MLVMPNQVGFVDDTVQLAHYAMVAAIRTFVLANGWTELRYDTSGVDHELIVKTPDLGQTVGFYVGIKTYHSETSDYYNLKIAGFTGYVAGNTFETQPGYFNSAVCAHNQRIDYWMSMNDRKLSVAMKVGTPVYESFYLGAPLSFATPGQFPYPLLISGTLGGAPGTRFSDTSSTHSMGYKGNTNRIAFRLVSGSVINPRAYPYQSGFTGMRDANGDYPLLPVVIYDTSSNIYGELDGIKFITGFNNAVENTLSINGETWVVIQDVFRTGFGDYYAMRLET